MKTALSLKPSGIIRRWRGQTGADRIEDHPVCSLHDIIQRRRPDKHPRGPPTHVLSRRQVWQVHACKDISSMMLSAPDPVAEVC